MSQLVPPSSSSPAASYMKPPIAAAAVPVPAGASSAVTGPTGRRSRRSSVVFVDPPLDHEQTVFLLQTRANCGRTQTWTSALLGLALLLMILGVLLQIIFCTWWMATVWGVGLLLLVSAAIVYSVGSGARSCLGNIRLCKAMHDYTAAMSLRLAKAQ